MVEKRKEFYLGRIFDPKSGKLTEENVYYDPAHLTTHAVVTGMTGSGKTGLCVGMLEEAALQGIPAIIIDPKGDLTNLVLHFPDLLPEDFKQWIDPDLPRREGKTLDEVAGETAGNWKKGLAGWDLGTEDILALKDSVEFSIYTPGSTAGIPINILSSFAAPQLNWATQAELIREDISSTVAGLLSLVGMSDIDPLRSKEHILLSNILENAWSQGKSLDLMELILQVQSPPFERLGAFPLDRFYPEKERFDLAMLLNNILASPSFQTWVEGQPLDVEKLLYSPDGKPRHSIFYIAHLSDQERMFIVTLLFAAIESWMRTQRGTSGLRALVYFDEILGYLPPVANPPSRMIMLRMLKQARAFGVGLLLATQNPVDVDYKALSNAGTWLIGRLQTERDKMRLLDGLQNAGGNAPISEIDKLISGLGKRTFVLQNVNKSGVKLFQTRWVMNYLAGPMMRSQIPALNELAMGSRKAATQPAAAQPAAAQSAQPSAAAAPVQPAVSNGLKSSGYTSTAPNLPGDLAEYYLPQELDAGQAMEAARVGAGAAAVPKGIVYLPALMAQASVRYLSSKYRMEFEQRFTALVQNLEGRIVPWEKHAWRSLDVSQLHRQPLPQAQFAQLPGWLSDERGLKAYDDDFIDWVYRNGTVRVKANEALKVYAGPEETTGSFREKCSAAARDGMQAELDKLEAAFEKKLDAIERKLDKQKLEVEKQEGELSQRRLEEMGTHGELLLGMLTSRRRRSVSSSLSKRRMTAQAKKELEQEELELDALEKDLVAMQKDLEEAKVEVQAKWTELVDDITEVPVSPMKKDIFLDLYGIAWLPHYLIQDGERVLEVPAFKAE
ncbi:MAG: ATP-binding protein [Chloroflexi bacterium]|nr:ATP-binding protein [Chloroflexota bacterium]